MTITGMEALTFAPRPAPRAWATAILSFPELLGPEWEPDSIGVRRWLHGVQFIPFGCDVPIGATFDPCVLRNIDYQTLGECVKFYPFMVEVGVTAPTLISTTEQLTSYVAAHIEVSRSAVLGAQVERSAFNTANPSLASEAQVIANTDTSLFGAMFAIETALADLLDGGAGMIHVAPGLLTLLAAGGRVRYDEAGRPYTATGHLIVADAGYLGVSPNTSNLVAGELWIYGSGPVWAKFDDRVTLIGDLPGDLNRSRNLWRVYGEQYGIAIFEPCSVVAAKVDISDGSIID